ncbi:MFS transporter [Candidatus Daviesbacteria bacterium]|nr:MFS transporter [Candidatus Daviesbacteria bacterium]
MVPIRNLYVHLRTYGLRHRALYIVSLMIFFWAIFDGIISYVTPLIITDHGFSKTSLGLIYGFSALAGGFFDFILSKYLNNTHFKRMYFWLFVVCFIYPLILWLSKDLWVYLIAMSAWGLYYALINFANFDFVSRKTARDEHSSSFGVISVFKGLGYLVAPILAGLLIGEVVGFKPFLLSWIFLVISALIYLVLIITTKKDRREFLQSPIHKRVNVLKELYLWKSVAKKILPVLLLTLMLNIFESFFWTVGPIISEGFISLKPFGGLFITAYLLPILFIGWIVGSVTKKWGKRRTAYLSFLLGSLVISSISLFQNQFIILAVVFISSSLVALAWPSINGVYADYITQSVNLEKEYEGLEDFFANLGYFIGPILAGVLADNFGNLQSFSYLGLFGALIMFLVMFSYLRDSKFRFTSGQ